MEQSFEEYLKAGRGEKDRHPERRIRDILEAVLEMTDCMQTLHGQGNILVDPSPASFCVEIGKNGDIEPGSVRLQKGSAVCSVQEISTFLGVKSVGAPSGSTACPGKEAFKPAGTEGLCAPELSDGIVDERSDIYSLGAILFYAFYEKCTYQNAFYNIIDLLLGESSLFREFAASEFVTESQEKAFVKAIGKILCKCLAKSPEDRYKNLAVLKKDLSGAENRLHKIFYRPVAPSVAGKAEPKEVMQKLLYEHPLYDTLKPGETNLNVLVLGSGIYSERFIDICLENGQMPGVQLNITSVSDDADESLASYLSDRPALKSFVNVNGEFEGREEPYATLVFKNLSRTSGDGANRGTFSRNMAVTRELLEMFVLEEQIDSEKEDFHYVFIAFGQDAFCKELAGICREIDGMTNGAICYLSGTKPSRSRRDKGSRLYAVGIDEEIELEKVGDLGQMAFNANLVWKSDMNFDMKEERENFFHRKEGEYQRISSMSFALSVKYKLHSISVEDKSHSLPVEDKLQSISAEDKLPSLRLDQMPPQEAADYWKDTILDRRDTDPEAKNIFNQMVELEHRRWVMDKVMDGWTVPKNFKGNLDFESLIENCSTHDNTRRTHICLVSSRADSSLGSLPAKVWEKQKVTGDWDQLDELDRMSLNLHWFYKKKADILRKNRVSLDQELDELDHLFNKDSEITERPRKQFHLAIENVLNGVASYSRDYDSYEKILKGAAEAEFSGEQNERKREVIREQLWTIKKIMYPVIESNLCRDYKKNDVMLVEKIPFILTGRHCASIAMAFEDGRSQEGRNNAIFANVASATMLAPEAICYLYGFDKTSNVELLFRKLNAVLGYLGKRKVHCCVHMVIVPLQDIQESSKTELEKKAEDFRKAHSAGTGNAWIGELKICETETQQGLKDVFLSCLKEYRESHSDLLIDGSNRFMASEYDNAEFLQKLRRSKFPYFEFHSAEKKFVPREGCEFLKYVQNDSFLRIHDMFALMSARDTRLQMPDFTSDYETLWDIYTKNASGDFARSVLTWNLLCKYLSEYDSDEKHAIRVNVPSAAGTDLKIIRIYSESERSDIESILAKLRDRKIVSSYKVRSISKSECRVEIVTGKKTEAERRAENTGKVSCEEFIKKLFPEKQGIWNFRDMKPVTYKNNENCITVSWPTVTDCATTGEKQKDLLKKLQAENYICDYTENGSLVSFQYKSPRFKKLLTSGGEILEIYAYYKAMETGYFDDVASSYEFSWEDGKVKNELDLVLTKGFRSMIVECKAVQKLELEQIHKLDSVASWFGISTTKVLLGNTYGASQAAINEMQRSRGSQMGIVNIYSKDDILRVGEKLKEIMEEI